MKSSRSRSPNNNLELMRSSRSRSPDNSLGLVTHLGSRSLNNLELWLNKDRNGNLKAKGLTFTSSRKLIVTSIYDLGLITSAMT